MRYLVLIEGRNCLMTAPQPNWLKRLSTLVQPETLERLGFFTTRSVEAPDVELAKCHALQVVERELVRDKLLRNPMTNPPNLTVSEIRPLEPSEVDPIGKGYTFFPENTIH